MRESYFAFFRSALRLRIIIRILRILIRLLRPSEKLGLLFKSVNKEFTVQVQLKPAHKKSSYNQKLQP